MYRLISHECEQAENGNVNHGWESKAADATAIGVPRRVNILPIAYRDFLGAKCGFVHHRPNTRRVIAGHMRLCIRCSMATPTIKCSVWYCRTLAYCCIWAMQVAAS